MTTASAPMTSLNAASCRVATKSTASLPKSARRWRYHLSPVGAPPLKIAPPKVFAAINPQTYPQTRNAFAHVRFNLRRANAALSSLSDRSRLVLPDVTIAKVGLAWVRPQLPALHHVASLIVVPSCG